MKIKSICSKELLYAMVLMLGSLTFGMTIVYASPGIEDMKKHFKIKTIDEQWFKSIPALTAISGPFVSELLLRFMGRRPATCVIAIMATVFWLLLQFMNERIFWYGILIRALNGVAMGAFSSIIPMYIVELAPTSAVGFFGSLNQLGIATGIVICYFIGNWSSWRVLAYCGAAIPALQTFLVWLIPESPASSIKAEKDVKKESIFQKEYLSSLLIGIAMMFFQQFSSVNGILNNLTSIFKNAGLTIEEGLASAISSISQILSVLIGSLIVDKIGRRNTWMISTGGTALSLLFYGLTTKYNWGSVMPIITIFTFQLFFNMGAAPIPWFIIPEILPESVRSVGTSIVSATNWICAFTVIFVYQFIYDAAGEFWTMIIFFIIMVFATIFGWFFITEPSNAAYNQLVE